MTKAIKQLGIWMDHSNAHTLEYTGGDMEAKTINSKFTSAEKEHSLGKSENLMHNKEQHQQSEYYKQIMLIIRNYDEVLLFGPTTAKNELANLMKSDHLFEKIKIDVKHSGKLTENQLHAFVRSYFSESQDTVNSNSL